MDALTVYPTINDHSSSSLLRIALFHLTYFSSTPSNRGVYILNSFRVLLESTNVNH